MNFLISSGERVRVLSSDASNRAGKVGGAAKVDDIGTNRSVGCTKDSTNCQVVLSDVLPERQLARSGLDLSGGVSSFSTVTNFNNQSRERVLGAFSDG